MVDTSVAVATPPPTVLRIRNGSTSAGAATSSSRPITAQRRAARAGHVLVARLPARQHAAARAAAPSRRRSRSRTARRSTRRPPSRARSARCDGGTVSAIAAPVASSAIISGGLWPRRFISGNSAGATVAMSDTFEPEMPETMNSEPSSTYDMPALTWPTRELEEVDDRLAHAGGVEHAAEQHEDRHRHQHDVGHAFVHATERR